MDQSPPGHTEIPGVQVGTGFSLCKTKILFHRCFVLCFLRGFVSLKDCRTGSDSCFLLPEKTHWYHIYLEQQMSSPCALSQIASWLA